MKKTVCILLILMLVFSLAALAACNKSENPPVDLDDSEKENTTLEKPEGKTPDQLSAKESLYVAVGELERSGGFTASAVGTTTSLMGITQSIAAERTVVGENVFKQSTSFSTFVKSGEQLYVYGENYLLRQAKSVSGIDQVTWENTATKYSTDVWNQLIGYRPNGLTGYVLNDNTILDAFFVSAENGLYTFRYVLDTQKAPHYLLYEMRHNANSERFPYFTKAEIVVTMDENFIVKTLSTDCEYRASSAGLSDLPCKENLTETFNVGYIGDLPQKAFFEQFFDASTVDQVEEKQETALDVLTSMLDEYLTKGKTLNAELTVSQLKTEYINALIALNVDLNNLENLTLNAKVGTNLFVNYANNRLLVDFQDFKGSANIDELLQYISSLYTDPFGGAIDFEIDTDALLAQMTYEINDNVARVSLPFNIANLHVEANLYGTVVEKGVYEFRNAVLGIGNLIVKLAPCEPWDVPSFDGEYPEFLSLTQLMPNGKIAFQTEVLDVAAKVMLDVASQQVFVNTDYFDCTLSDNTLYANVGDAKIKFDLNAADTILGLLYDLVEPDLPMLQVDGASMQIFWDIINNITATKQGENTVLSVNVDGLAVEIVLVEQTDGWCLESIEVNIGEQKVVLTPTEQFEVSPIGNTDDYADATQAAIDFIPALVELKNAESYQVDFGSVWQFGAESFCLYFNGVVQPYGENLALDVNFEIIHNLEQVVAGNAVLLNNYLYLTVNDIKVAISVADLGKSTDGELQNLLSSLSLEINNKTLKSVADKIQSIVERVQQGLSITDVIGLVQDISYSNYKLTLGVDGQLFDVNDFDLVASVLQKGVALSFDDLVLGDASVYAVAMLRATDEQVAMDCPEEYAHDVSDVFASLNSQLVLNGKVTLGSDLYDIALLVHNDNGNIEISVEMSYGGVGVLDATVYVFGNKLYAMLDGVRFATSLSESESSLQDTTALEEILSVLRGKNEYLDKLLNYVEEVKGKAQNGQISAEKLLKKIVIGEESVSVVLDGTELYVSEMVLTLNEKGITLCANGFAYEDICADISVNANLSDKVVTQPTGDWNTYLAIAIDEHNTLFANLDLLNGVFVFKLENDLTETAEDGSVIDKEPLYIEYIVANNSIRLKKGDVKICGDIQEIADIVAYIDGLVKDFAGYSEGLIDLAGLTNIDIKQLLKTLSVDLTSNKANNTSTLKLSTSDFKADIYITNHDVTAIDHIDVLLGNTTYRIAPCEAFALPDFGNKKDYVDLNQVLNDYLPTIEALVHTHSWTFDFNSDSQIDVKDQQGSTTSYQIAAGSYVKFYFNLAQPEDFMLRANIILKQLKNGVWEDFITVDAAFINGRIYVTYNETLKFSISLEAIASCSDLIDELRQTIPQLDELLNNLANAKDDAEQLVNNLDYSAIIKGISYDKESNAFGIVLNGRLFSDKLGDITIYTLRTENTITLEQLSLTYDNVSLNLCGITVSASELTELDDGETIEHDYENYVVAGEVLQYLTERGDESAHINFDSLRQLLRALIDTAQNDTFAIDGDVTAVINIINMEVKLQLHLRIDLDEDGYVYIAAQIVRANDNLIYDDYGGYSYLHYNGKTGEFTVIRNSYYKQLSNIKDSDYCTKCQTSVSQCKSRILHRLYVLRLTQNDYSAELTTEDFVATLQDQIFEMLNFSDIIENAIKNSMNGESSDEGLSTNDTLAQLQNIFLNYEYETNVDTDSMFKVQADLSPLNQNFGKLNLNVGHTYLINTVTDQQGNTTTSEKLVLTSLTGDFTLATIVKLNWDLALQQNPTHGQGIDFVTNNTHWMAE